MNSNQICNPKVEVPKGLNLNDKDYIGSLLSCLKDMEKNYVIAMSEASNESLYDIFKDVFLNLADMQREVYELMFRKGWYQLEKAPEQKIEQKHQLLSTEYQNLHS